MDNAIPSIFLLGLFVGYIFILSPVSGQRYYACDPTCPERCAEAADESEVEDVPVCVHIPDVYMEIVTFSNECAFNCANKCYEYQLHINYNGTCGFHNPKPTSPKGYTIPTQTNGNDETDDY